MKPALKPILKNGLFLVLFLLVGMACKKEECKQCYLDETNSYTGAVTTISTGKKCGTELKNTDGKEYIGVSGPAKAYCE